MKTIRLGYINLSFHQVSAAIIQRVFEQEGYKVIAQSAPHEEMFRRYCNNEVDVLVSAWLPASHDKYLAPCLANTVKITTLYEPYCIWGVPDYIPVEEIASICDLIKPTLTNKISKLIQGINPGAGISRFSESIIKSYHLDKVGYYFKTGSQQECFDRFEQAVLDQQWIIIPLWHPQYLHYQYKIRELTEPRGLLGDTDQATLIIREEIASQLNKSFIDKLKKLTIGNREMSKLDYLFSKEKIPALEVADSWLNTQQNNPR